jgi:Domain of Unknown Function (DUF326)
MATATLFKEMLEAHPWPAQIDRDVLVRCIDECSTCETLCTACADASLAEGDVVEMRKCIRLCLDCADICGSTGRLLTRQTEYVAAAARAQVSSCRELCAACSITTTAASAPRNAGAARTPARRCSRHYVRFRRWPWRRCSCGFTCARPT